MKYRMAFYIVIFFDFLTSLNAQVLFPELENRNGDILSEKVMPTLGCWFWAEAEFEPNGYKQFIDQFSLHSAYNYLTMSMRIPEKEVTDVDVYEQIKAAAIYARDHGVPMVTDLDVRLARREFEAKYPDELQEMLLLQELTLSTKNSVDAVIHSFDLSDHYTGQTTNYIPLRSALLRVYSYVRGSDGIDPETLKDITKECVVVSASKDSVHVRIPKKENSILTQACVMVAFTHLTPDVFAPHLMEFQRKIIEKYSDVPLAGVNKDEWGFPPSFDGNPEKNQFWYSKYRAKAYNERTKGRDLLADCLLMHAGIKGEEEQRQMAINHFMEMSWKRNGELENDFYNTVKETFGADAIVATHPTWWPYPDLHEYKKNGLDWWVVKRDWAQTDELTPFAVRTALSKKWNSSVWYNMYYSKEKADYVRSLWSYALAGGRINYHRLYPSENFEEAGTELLRGNLMLAESRVHLLNYISQSPLYSPVAVIFGHACTMNWAGPAYNDVGMEIVNNLWQEGFPADLIPSSEIENKSLYIDKDGWICYGAQRYEAVVLYHPEFEKSSTAEFFNKAQKDSTSLFKVGNWTKDFEGKAINENTVLRKSMIELTNAKSIVSEIVNVLQTRKILPQTPATSQLEGFGHISCSPPTTGFCRLIDGTIIQIAGTNNVTGDPIQSKITINDYEVTFDAIGVAAVRLDDKGRIEAMAAGGLNYFRVGDFKIKLNKRADIALWKDNDGKWRGVLKGWKGAIPLQLLAITNNWTLIDIPVPL